VGGFQAAVFAQPAAQRQAGNHRHESCRAQSKEVRNFIAKRMSVRRPGFMRLCGAQASAYSGEARITFHAAMVWFEPEKSSPGIKG
jgi:hypothetical protein